MNGLLRQFQRRGFIVVANADVLLIAARGRLRKLLEEYGNQALEIVAD